MSGLLSGLTGPHASMVYIRKGVKARQVTTHTHDSVPVEVYNAFDKIGHWDFKNLRAGSSWEFPVMEGPVASRPYG